MERYNKIINDLDNYYHHSFCREYEGTLTELINEDLKRWNDTSFFWYMINSNYEIIKCGCHDNIKEWIETNKMQNQFENYPDARMIIKIAYWNNEKGGFLSMKNFKQNFKRDFAKK